GPSRGGSDDTLGTHVHNRRYPPATGPPGAPRPLPSGRKTGVAASSGGLGPRVVGTDHIASRSCLARAAVSDGVLPTLTPAASRASFLAWAVPEEPETMAPAWPMVLPSGAVKPAT